MNSPNETNNSKSKAILPESTNEPQSESTKESTSATTNDIPEFGWSAYSERVNGRFAMIGFVALLLIEALSHETFLKWSGLIN